MVMGTGELSLLLTWCHTRKSGPYTLPRQHVRGVHECVGCRAECVSIGELPGLLPAVWWHRKRKDVLLPSLSMSFMEGSRAGHRVIRVG